MVVRALGHQTRFLGSKPPGGSMTINLVLSSFEVEQMNDRNTGDLVVTSNLSPRCSCAS